MLYFFYFGTELTDFLYYYRINGQKFPNVASLVSHFFGGGEEEEHLLEKVTGGSNTF